MITSGPGKPGNVVPGVKTGLRFNARKVSFSDTLRERNVRSPTAFRRGFRGAMSAERGPPGETVSVLTPAEPEAFANWIEEQTRRRFYVGFDVGPSVDPSAIAVIERIDEPGGDCRARLRRRHRPGRAVPEELSRKHRAHCPSTGNAGGTGRRGSGVLRRVSGSQARLALTSAPSVDSH